MFRLVLRDNIYSLSYQWKNILQLYKKSQLYLNERERYMHEQ